jgi:hypothetical protein
MKQIDSQLIPSINRELDLDLSESIAYDELKQNIVSHINHLINDDFEKLVYILYRVDVNESKIVEVLEKTRGENAAEQIAELIIERQSEKIKTRKEYGQDGADISNDEKW